jgi:ketosteroid isomerase-like protein
MHIKKTSLLFAAFFCCTSALLAQILVDAEKERPMIEHRLDEYSKYLLDGDSVSLTAMYAENAAIGCKKGPEILAAMGGWVRNGIKNNSRHVVFKTSSLTADGELLSEIGTAESRSDKGELKYTFRYLVVWKKENGIWKLYRDIAL